MKDVAQNGEKRRIRRKLFCIDTNFRFNFIMINQPLMEAFTMRFSRFLKALT